jgi:hypothetical protein
MRTNNPAIGSSLPRYAEARVLERSRASYESVVASSEITPPACALLVIRGPRWRASGLKAPGQVDGCPDRSAP